MIKIFQKNITIISTPPSLQGHCKDVSDFLVKAGANLVFFLLEVFIVKIVYLIYWISECSKAEWLHNSILDGDLIRRSAVVEDFQILCPNWRSMWSSVTERSLERMSTRVIEMRSSLHFEKEIVALVQLDTCGVLKCHIVNLEDRPKHTAGWFQFSILHGNLIGFSGVVGEFKVLLAWSFRLHKEKVLSLLQLHSCAVLKYDIVDLENGRKHCVVLRGWVPAWPPASWGTSVFRTTASQSFSIIRTPLKVSWPSIGRSPFSCAPMGSIWVSSSWFFRYPGGSAWLS